MLIRIVTLCILVASSAWPGWAYAQPPEASEEADAATKAAARELGLDGIKLYQSGDYAKALDKLSRAHELVGLTTTGLWRARCLVALGRFVEGSEALFAVTRMPLPADAKPVHVDAQRKAAEERKALQPRIPRLVIKIVGELPADTLVTLDGREVPPALLGVKQPVDPGEHVLEARGAGTSAKTKIDLAEGQVLEVPVRLVDRDGPTKARESSPNQEDAGNPVLWTVGWIVTGLGAAGLIVGAVTGGLAISERDSLEASCPNGDCPPPFHSDVDSFETLRLTSTVAFIAGGVVAATGVTLVITGALTGGADEPPAIETGLLLSPMGLLIRGRF